MAIQYKIVHAKIVHPLVDTVVGQRQLYNKDGTPKIIRTQKFNEDGTPDLELVPVEVPVLKLATNDALELVSVPSEETQPSSTVFAKRPKWDDIHETEDVIEAVENEDLPPDGITYNIEAWDEDTPDTKIELNFHIGKSAFEAVQPHQRPVIIAKEVEILYTKAKADWREGLELS